jgi:hypothetical protein
VGVMAKEGKLKVENFNGQNYQLWKMHMEDYLYQKDLWQPLGGKVKKPSAMSDEDWDILDQTTLGNIHLCLPPSVAFNISTAKTTEHQDLMWFTQNWATSTNKESNIIIQ